MDNVRRLVFAFVLGVAPDIGFPNKTEWVLNCLKSMRGLNHLEELTLVLYPSQDNIPDNDEWPSRLDFLLTQDGFPSISRVSIYLISAYTLAFPEHTEANIIRQMPLLQTSRILTVKELKVWDFVSSEWMRGLE